MSFRSGYKLGLGGEKEESAGRAVGSSMHRFQCSDSESGKYWECAGMNKVNQLKARIGQTTPPPIAIMNFTMDLC